ncbi:dicarboxylate/amino acid:cation symporter [Burkholderia stagnalis]|uniref:C4-dicarboxylate ABC transporter n=1 Tax=Burkholderia stagnalis TaxID=1503054 RepID=A0A107U1M0_9BURK|nr:dicarboxylate/amino acid:cation symporter [Burkholderia stagnalis]AOK53745.1 C4-dicarboxylate ABC transporter [Burkholderia stagnalis]KAB0635044.1 dicarboxylate/amino acid:cation symporter [Burkholderia stagnalis]KVM89137.1 C4-dicarboxylate ABC transporter [Burkholderia stagnalis]KVN37309.1 C4-dicarboxylate ABC transporter [Burkholderia stagnalis]KVN66868.1 C4-dicarboxylate ABC transporter [Burkholderia stagnalis]
MQKKRNITSYIVIAMILGIAVGYGCHSAFPDPKVTKEIAGYVSLLSDIFLRLIKMIIAPLVFATLTVGIAHMGDTNAVGRVGVKALGWFVIASFVSLLFGLVTATLLQPGSHLSLPLPASDAATNLKTGAFTLKDFVTHLVPKSIGEAMSNNEILQIVVFSIFFGTALSALGEKGRRLTGVIEDLAQVMLKVTGAVMWFAPIAVFAALASTITTQGLGILLTFAKFMGSFYLALALLWGMLTLAGLVFLGKRTFSLIRLIREPFLLSFATASSEAAYPKLLDALDRFGVNRKISSFVLPMGYSFNLDGSMMYCTFAVLFITQAYGIHLPLGTQLTMLLLLMLTSKGMAGVPRASLVVIAATLNQFNLPEAGLLLIMGVDTFLDMGRSATNAVGNSIAAAVIAKWEGQLGAENDGVDAAGAQGATAEGAQVKPGAVVERV